MQFAINGIERVRKNLINIATSIHAFLERFSVANFTYSRGLAVAICGTFLYDLCVSGGRIIIRGLFGFLFSAPTRCLLVLLAAIDTGTSGVFTKFNLAVSVAAFFFSYIGFFTTPLVFMVWFTCFVLFLVSWLFFNGLVILPLLFTGVYIGIIAILLVASFWVVGKSATAGKTTQSGSTWPRYFCVGILVLLSGGSAATILVGTADAGFHLYSGRAGQLVFQKFLFFNADVLSLYPLFDCFFWALLLVGVYLLMTAVVVDWSSSTKSAFDPFSLPAIAAWIGMAVSSFVLYKFGWFMPPDAGKPPVREVVAPAISVVPEIPSWDPYVVQLLGHLPHWITYLLGVLLLVDTCPGHAVIWWFRLVRLPLQPVRYLWALLSGCVLRPAVVNAYLFCYQRLLKKPRTYWTFFDLDEVKFPGRIVLPRPRRPNLPALWHCWVGFIYLAWSYEVVLIALTYATRPTLSITEVVAVFVCSLTLLVSWGVALRADLNSRFARRQSILPTYGYFFDSTVGEFVCIAFGLCVWLLSIGILLAAIPGGLAVVQSTVVSRLLDLAA